MNQPTKVQVKHWHLAALIAGGILFTGLLYASTGGSLPSLPIGDSRDSYDTRTVSGDMTLQDQFDVLRTKSTNACGAQPQHLDNIPDGQRMQGSCCSKMVFHSYEEQIAGLAANYSDYEIIPSDPYNVSVRWAKQMIEYGEDTELTAEQQAIYDEATEISHEGGPCCCVCWHWYAYGVLGEKLIVEYDFTAEQIAHVWDLSDACGGNLSHA